MTVSVILVTFVSLTFVGAAALLQMQIGKMQDDFYGKVEVAVYLCPAGTSSEPTCAGGEVTDDQKQAILDALDAPDVAPYIESVTAESKEQAFETFQRQFEGQYWAQVMTVDDMNESLRIKLTDPALARAGRRHAAGRGAAHHDDHPALGAQPPARDRDHADGRRVEPVHPAASWMN